MNAFAALASGPVLAVTLAAAPPGSPAPAYTPAPLPPEQALFSWLPPRDPLIAAGLSLGVNGAGQFYNHQSEKGWWMLAPVLLFPAAWALDYVMDAGYARAGVAVLFLGAKVYSVFDAYQSAQAAESSARP